ncbi:MAG: hypothetical protein AABY74_04335, partial [Planctomycetota bacterium]
MRVSDFEFRVSDFGFRISSFGFRISSFVVWFVQRLCCGNYEGFTVNVIIATDCGSTTTKA